MQPLAWLFIHITSYLFTWAIPQLVTLHFKQTGLMLWTLISKYEINYELYYRDLFTLEQFQTERQVFGGLMETLMSVTLHKGNVTYRH